MRLEELTPGTLVRGLVAGVTVKVVQVEWFGDQAVKVTFEEPNGAVRNRLVYRSDEASLELVGAGRAWSFDGDGDLFRLASEAQRIRLAYLFDPYLALSTSLIEPLPHQITAVYGEMLPRQPLRFLLADDPGAGKTIMAGLLIKELLIRGDLERCLIVAPGSLVEQWQDELAEKFGLDFDILTRDQIEARRTGNPFAERGPADRPARHAEPQRGAAGQAARRARLGPRDLRRGAPHVGHLLRRRGQVDQALPARAAPVRHAAAHFLLMTATPHNGKEEDFQLFMALLDGDRFEGRFREGVHTADVTDMMRRLTKEELHDLRRPAAVPRAPRLHRQLRALGRRGRPLRGGHRLRPRGDEPRRAAGRGRPAPQQRRLRAADPAAPARLLAGGDPRIARAGAASGWSAALDEERLLQRGRDARLGAAPRARRLSPRRSSRTSTTGPRTRSRRPRSGWSTAPPPPRRSPSSRPRSRRSPDLEQLAKALRRSGTDTKWRELQRILDQPLMTDAAGNRRKLIIFTEPRDTLDYLADKIRTRLGRAEAVVAIHGGLAREARRTAIARLPARPGGPGPGRQRRRRRGRQPPARPPDGQLRPALEPEPHRAALRPHPPHRPDRGLPPLEPGRARDPRGRGLRPPAGEAGGGARGARRPGLRRPRRAVRADARCATS